MKKVELIVRERESFGSAESRRLRRSGWIPGVLYAKGDSSTPLAVEEKSLKRALGSDGGSAILTLTFEGKNKEHPAIMKEYQANPLGRGVMHVDFMEVRMDQPVEAVVRLELEGNPAGLREGGILDHTLRELHVRCLPGDIPESIHHGIEEMQIGDSLKVGDIAVPANVEILNEPESQVASIMAPTLVKEEAAEGGEGAEAAAAPGEKPAGGESEAEA
ncbi:MAG: 50S ribosomal protein L25 [Thermoleophilia bacterium]